ncbi:MAG TPA: glycosyltransferase family 4 protein, partial [Thermoanaerobaculia bacterium]|nr:glycosyltransferase family 4 protein [Thermoanaerobaculia bacterium]
MSAAAPRAALVHDWLTGMRGGERVLEELCDLYPDAQIFTLVHIEGSVSRTIERHSIRTSWIQRLPNAGRLYRHYLPLHPLAVESFDL